MVYRLKIAHSSVAPLSYFLPAVTSVVTATSAMVVTCVTVVASSLVTTVKLMSLASATDIEVIYDVNHFTVTNNVTLINVQPLLTTPVCRM